jgi:shikimate kinase
MKPAQDNVALIGMPAAGKSTVGVLLAKRLGMGFVDTDIVIQGHEQQTLQQIIRAHGNNGFRAVEQGHILDLKLHKHIIATGGSVVYSRRAMAHLAAMATIVFLKLSLKELTRRLDNLDARGVLIAPGQSLATLFYQRDPLYREYAHVTVPCDGLAADQVKEAVVARLAPFGFEPPETLRSLKLSP